MVLFVLLEINRVGIGFHKISGKYMDCTIFILAWEGAHEFKYYYLIILIFPGKLHRDTEITMG